MKNWLLVLTVVVVALFFLSARDIGKLERSVASLEKLTTRQGAPDVEGVSEVDQAEYGWIDNVTTCSHVEGWAWDPDRPDKPVLVVVLYDGKRIATVTADRYRPDLEEAGVGNGRHAFVVETGLRLLYSTNPSHKLVVRTWVMKGSGDPDRVVEQQIGGSPRLTSCR